MITLGDVRTSPIEQEDIETRGDQLFDEGIPRREIEE